MAKYICLEKELDISKYNHIKSLGEGVEIVYYRGYNDQYPEGIENTETYQCFKKITGSIRQTYLTKSYKEMEFYYVYDVGQINDVILLLALSDTEINLIIDISFDDLEELSDSVDTLSDKYGAAGAIKGGISEMIDQINEWGDKLEGEIDLEELTNYSGYEYDLQQIMKRTQQDIYDNLIEYQYTP